VEISMYRKTFKGWPKTYTQPISSAALQGFHQQSFYARRMPPAAVTPVVPGPRPPYEGAQQAVYVERPGKGAVAGGYGKINGS